MDENVKRAEKAIHLVVSHKEQISAFCTRINSALNIIERRGLENFEQLIIQLDALIQLPPNSDHKRSPPEMILCQVNEKFRQLSEQEILQIDSSQTVLVQTHLVRVQINHHPQSAFKPIQLEQD